MKLTADKRILAAEVKTTKLFGEATNFKSFDDLRDIARQIGGEGEHHGPGIYVIRMPDRSFYAGPGGESLEGKRKFTAETQGEGVYEIHIWGDLEDPDAEVYSHVGNDATALESAKLYEAQDDVAYVEVYRMLDEHDPLFEDQESVQIYPET